MDPNVDWSKIPSAPPPEGTQSNFVNPQSNSRLASVIISILLPLMIPCVILRIYCNIWIVRKFAFSDYTCALATIASIAFTSVLYLTISQDIIGRHIWDVPISMNTDSSVQNFSVLAILYGPAIFLAKLSVLLLYLELFELHKATRIMTAIAITIITAQCIVNIVGFSVLCVPKPGGSWMLADATHGCTVTTNILGIVMGSISVLSDFYIILIPIPVIWRLQLARRRKIGVSMIFVTGIFACIASIFALVYRIRQYIGHDNTWNSSYTYPLSVVEMNVTIMCSCMPSFAACLNHHIHFIRSISSSLRTKYFRGSSRRHGSSTRIASLEGGDSGSYQGDGENIRLTLGSTVKKDGKFVQSSKIWPVDSRDEEQGDATNREHLETRTYVERSSRSTELKEDRCRGARLG